MRNLIVGLLSALAVSACATNTVSHAPPVAAVAEQAQMQQMNSPLTFGAGPQVKLRYPGFDGIYGIEGTVILLVLVMPGGHVTYTKVEKSAGHRELDRAAIDAVHQWHFTPERKNGVAVEGYARLPVNFSISNRSVPRNWPAKYIHPRYLIDTSAIPYASVDAALLGVSAVAHGPMDNKANSEVQNFVIRDGKGVIRERWSFTDMDTEDAMALRYVFTGTPGEPVVRVAALCRSGVASCESKVPWLLRGPVFARSSAESSN